MKILISIAIASLWIPVQVSASLSFAESKITHQASLDESEYTAVFKFTNGGDEPIEILSVNSSCGCTTALPSKTNFAPGESGEISATFDYGQREGKQVKSIRVETDQESDNRIFLTLEVNIPSVLAVSPSVTMWNRSSDADFESKEVTIESFVDEPIEITEVVSSSDLFAHQVKELIPGKKFSFQVTPTNIPTDSKGIVRGTFVIKTNFENPMKGTLKVYAIVR